MRNTAGLRTASSDVFALVPLTVYIIHQSDGSGGMSEAQVNAAMARLNDNYHQVKLYFYLCGAIQHINSDDLASFDNDAPDSDDTFIRANHYTTNTLNVYFTPDLIGACGYAYYPDGSSANDIVLMDSACTVYGNTLEHEMGHAFYLPHTHNDGDELVNGSNCLVAGDGFCDTPADPNLSGNVDVYGCLYTGTATDANTDPYDPDVFNIMSYSSSYYCRSRFSVDQMDMMYTTATTHPDRTKLVCPSAGLAAHFTTETELSCNTTTTTQFYDLSQGGATSWTWDFGDASGSSSQNPTHTYGAAGSYTVTLTVGDGLTTEQTSITIQVQNAIKPTELPFSENFEGADPLAIALVEEGQGAALYLDASAANGGSMGVMMEGHALSINYGSGSARPFYYRPDPDAEAMVTGWNETFRTALGYCVDATNLSDLTVSYDVRVQRYLVNDLSAFHLEIDGAEVVGTFLQPSGADVAYHTETINLDAYVGQVRLISFAGKSALLHDEVSSTSGTSVRLDNINFTGNPLPVEWVSFSVIPDDGRARLLWVTTEEIDNEGFEVQRSLTQEGPFEAIGFVIGQGGSGLNQYEFVDGQPLEGRSYYRLAQVDYDNDTTYSVIRTLYWELAESLIAYPNPSANGFEVAGSGGMDLTVEVFDLGGRRLEVATLLSGEGRFGQTLGTGVYQVRITSASGQQEWLRVVKL